MVRRIIKIRTKSTKIFSKQQYAYLLCIALSDPTLTKEDRENICRWWNEDQRREKENGK